MKNTWVLAQTETSQGSSQIGAEPMNGQPQEMTLQDGSNTSTPADQQGKQQGPPNYMFMILMAGLVVMMYMSFRGPKKRQQEHTKMLQALKKNDRVRTAGGIFGTVMEVKGDEVVLKIDEATNTKIRVSSSAISTNMSKENQ